MQESCERSFLGRLCPVVQALDGTQKISRQDYPCSETMVSHGWRVLDIGAGSGILSLPLCAIGCDGTAMEPSIGMRSLLYKEALNRGIDWIRGSEEKL